MKCCRVRGKTVVSKHQRQGQRAQWKRLSWILRKLTRTRYRWERVLGSSEWCAMKRSYVTMGKEIAGKLRGESMERRWKNKIITHELLTIISWVANLDFFFLFLMFHTVKKPLTNNEAIFFDVTRLGHFYNKLNHCITKYYLDV